MLHGSSFGVRFRNVRSDISGGFGYRIRKEESSFVKVQELIVSNKGNVLEKKYKADFVCYDEIIIELKAVSELADVHLAQIINYLKITGSKLGLLVNFGQESLEYKRVVN